MSYIPWLTNIFNTDQLAGLAVPVAAQLILPGMPQPLMPAPAPAIYVTDPIMAPWPVAGGNLIAVEDLNSLPDGQYAITVNGETYNLWLMGDNKIKGVKSAVDSNKPGFGFTHVTYAHLPDHNQVPDFNQMFLERVEFGHCVGKNGICRHFRMQADYHQSIYNSGLKINAKGEEKKLTKTQRDNILRHVQEYRSIADQIEVLMERDYPNGILLEELDKVCRLFKIKVEIRFPGKLLDGTLNKTYRCGDFQSDKTYATVHFTNVKKNHLDLVFLDNQYTVVSEAEFKEKVMRYQESGSVFRVWECFNYENNKPFKEIYALNHVDGTFVIDKYEHYLANSQLKTAEQVWFNKYRPYFIWNTDRFFPLVYNSCHFPVWYLRPNESLYRGAIDQSLHSTITEYLQYDQDHYWMTDMSKAYLRYMQSKYYRHVPGKPNAFGVNPDWTQAEGWWHIESDATVPFIGPIGDCCWTSVHLRFFQAHGYPFKVTFGCWSRQELTLDDMPLDRKAYAFMVGRLCQAHRYREERYIDPKGMLRTGGDPTLSFGVLYEQPEYKMGCNLASYILAAETTMILDFALRHNVLAITGDGLVTKEALDLSTSKLRKGPDGRWSKSDVLLGHSPYNRNPDLPAELWKAPEKVPVRSLMYKSDGTRQCWAKSYYSFYKLALDLPTSTPPVLPEVSYYEGPGGYGKTTRALQHYGYLSPTYIAPRLALVADKVPREFQRGMCSKSWPNIEDGIKAGLRYDVPSLLIFDEVPLTETSTYQLVMRRCRDYKIPVILIGDLAQLPSPYLDPAIVKGLSQYTAPEVFTHDFRSKSDRFRAQKRFLWELSMGQRSLSLPELESWLLKNFKSWDSSSKLPVLTYYNASRYENSWLNKYESHTIDTVQGQTLETPHVLHMNFQGQRKEQGYQIAYTMVSRFRDPSHIHLRLTHLVPEEAPETKDYSPTASEYAEWALYLRGHGQVPQIESSVRLQESG